MFTFCEINIWCIFGLICHLHSRYMERISHISFSILWYGNILKKRKETRDKTISFWEEISWKSVEDEISLKGKINCVCVFVLRPSLYPCREGGTWALNSACKTDRADFTDWMSFLPSISWSKSALIQKHGNAEKTMI